jgi:hypothetical protein
LRIFRSGAIERRIDKIHVAFIEHLYFRHPRTLRKWVESVPGGERWVVLAALKQIQSNQRWAYERVAPLVFAKWILHVADRHLFPLGDFALLRNGSGSRLWCALSPRVLLEVCVDQESTETSTVVSVTPAREKSLMRHYRRLCIASASSQIISHDPRVLEEWADSVDCKERCRELGLSWSRT